MKLRRVLALAAILILGLTLLPQPAFAIGRDILLVSRTQGVWVRSDTVVVILADGSRLRYDLNEVPWENKSELEDLLFILRTHGISCNSLLFGIPAPEELSPIGQEAADRLRALIGGLAVEPFEPAFYATDLGSIRIYAVRPVDGETSLVPIAERGSLIGQSPDATTAEILALAEAWLGEASVLPAP